jgi:hypothetical protein
MNLFRFWFNNSTNGVLEKKFQSVMTSYKPLSHLDPIEESVRPICHFKIIRTSNFEQFVSETGLLKATSRERWFI